MECFKQTNKLKDNLPGSTSSPRLVPTLRGDPAWVFGQFGLSVARLFNAAQYGKSQKRLAGRQFPLDYSKDNTKACLPRACTHNRHAGVFVQASPARKFETQLSQSRGKIHAQNAANAPKF